MTFTDHLHALAEPVWRAQHQHPFVRGIGAGTLALERFAQWVRQDYLFLIEYCRVFGLAAALLPCMWGYSEIRQRLPPPARRYRDNNVGRVNAPLPVASVAPPGARGSASSGRDCCGSP